MGVLAAIRRVFIPPKRKAWPYSVQGGTTLTRVGFDLGDERIQDPYGQNSWTHTAVKKKGEAVSSVPFKFYTGKRGTAQKQELPETDPWVQLFERPSPLFPSWQDFAQAVSTFLDLYGEAPQIALGEDGEWKKGTVPAEVCLVLPTLVREHVNPLTLMIEWWDVSQGAGMMRVPPFQVGMLKEICPTNPYRGLSPLLPIALAIDFDFAIHQFNVALLRNGADPGGVVKVPGAKDWTQKQMDVFEQMWNDVHKGARKAGKLAVIDKEADYIPITVNGKQMQWMEALEWSRGEIKATLGVTDLELGMFTDQTFANAAQARKWFWENTIIPRMVKIQDFLWSWLFKPYSVANGVNVWGEFDVSGVPVLRHAFESRLASIAHLAPHLGINQIADVLDIPLPKVPWGDEPAGTAMPLGEEPTVSEGGPPVVASKSKAYAAEMKGWQDTAEKVMVRAVRDYFRGLRALALGNLRGKKSVAVAALLGDPEQWEAVAEASFAPSIQRIIALMKRALKRQGFSVFPPDKELAKIARARMAQLVKVSKRDRVRLGTRLRTFLSERDDGASVEEMAKEIDDHFKTQNSGRAMTIARTEAAMVGGQIRHETFKAAGVEKVQWSAAMDEFTRESHRRVDGEVIEMGQKYSNGLRYPSEPGAPAAEVINCRCTEVPA